VIAALQRYKWVTRGSSCPRCLAMAGEVRSLEAWQAGLQPGFHRHCDCALEPLLAALGESEVAIEKPTGRAGMGHVVTDIRGYIIGSTRGLQPSAARPAAEPNLFVEARRGYTGY
jgi:hypothetical protein